MGMNQSIWVSPVSKQTHLFAVCRQDRHFAGAASEDAADGVPVYDVARSPVASQVRNGAM